MVFCSSLAPSAASQRDLRDAFAQHVASRRWIILRKWTRGFLAISREAHATHLKAQERRIAEAALAGATDRIKLEVTSNEELAALPYWQQGDTELNTAEALDLRGALRHEPAIVAELQVWWEAAQRSLQSGPDPTASAIPKADYLRMSRMLSKVMLSEADFDRDEAQAAAEEDWAEDAGGGDEMARERFMNGLFELADVWTVGIDAAEYVAFLRGLLDRIAFQQSDCTWLWRDEGGLVSGAPSGEYEHVTEAQTHDARLIDGIFGAVAAATRLRVRPRELLTIAPLSVQ